MTYCPSTRLVAPGPVSPQDAFAIMRLCPFETVAKKLSSFWSLCSRGDFEIYESTLGTSRSSARRVRITLYRCHAANRSSGMEVF